MQTTQPQVRVIRAERSRKLSLQGGIYAVYKLWDNHRYPFREDEDVEYLDNGEELEIIFERPDHPDRFSYTEWRKNQHVKAT